MDTIERKIKDLSKQIQTDEPNNGHFERFEMKLNRNTNNNKNIVIKFAAYALSLAAVLAIAIILVTPNHKNNHTLRLSDVSPHYANVEMYYTNTIGRQMQQLETLANQPGGNELIEMLVAEIEAYDQIYEKLCADLQTAPTDERVINAMLAFYQTKLEIINKILFEIENKKNTNYYETSI